MENKLPEQDLIRSRPRWFYILEFVSLIALALMGGLIFNAIALGIIRLISGEGVEADALVYISQPENVKYYWIIVIANTIGFFGFSSFVFPLYIKERPMGFLGLKDKPAYYYISLAILLFIVIQPLSSFLVWLNAQVDLPAAFEYKLRKIHDNQIRVQDILTNQLAGGRLFIAIIGMAVLPALLEELFFRKALMKVLFDITRRPHLSIFISALLFSVIHFEFYYLLPMFVLGLLLGYLVYWTGNIWIPIVAHLTNNLLALTGKYFSQQYPDHQIFSEDYQFPWLTILLSFVFVTSIVWLIQRNKNLTITE